MNYAEFLTFAAEHISDTTLQTAFEVFNILPGRAEVGDELLWIGLRLSVGTHRY